MYITMPTQGATFAHRGCDDRPRTPTIQARNGRDEVASASLRLDVAGGIACESQVRRTPTLAFPTGMSQASHLLPSYFHVEEVEEKSRAATCDACDRAGRGERDGVANSCADLAPGRRTSTHFVAPVVAPASHPLSHPRCRSPTGMSQASHPRSFLCAVLPPPSAPTAIPPPEFDPPSCAGSLPQRSSGPRSSQTKEEDKMKLSTMYVESTPSPQHRSAARMSLSRSKIGTEKDTANFLRSTVPEPLRPHYDEAMPRCEDAGAQSASSQLPLLSAVSWYVSQIAPGCTDEEWASLSNLARSRAPMILQHLHALEQAEHALANARILDNNARRAAKLYTCPVCDQYDQNHTELGLVQTRTLRGKHRPDALRVVSCLRCFDVAVAASIATDAAQLVAKRRTRGELVAAHVTALANASRESVSKA